MTIRIMMDSPVARVQAIVFVALMAAFGAFASGLDNYNTISRIGLTANFVQHGRIDIEGYADLTADKAKSGDKYYSDKAPGMSFLAVPAAFLFTRAVEVTPDIDVKNPDAAGRRLSLLTYVCIVLTSGLVTALAGAMLFGFVKRETQSWTAAGVATAAYALATPTWAWATSFFGHAAAGALLIIGFLLLDELAKAAFSRAQALRAIAAGAALGAAVSIEFTAAIAAAIIVVCYALRAFTLRRDLRNTFFALVAVSAAAAAVQIPLLVYNSFAFGGPFKLGYSNVVGWEGMKQGIFGISAPDFGVLVQILIGAHRGILWLSPVVALAFAAAIWLARQPGQRIRAGAILGVTAFYLAMNAGYAYWDGGASTGPRHITPLFPFIALALGLWFAQASNPWRIAIGVALGISILINLMVVSVTTMAAPDIKIPLTDRIIPTFLAGDLKQSMMQIALGAHGLWQLLPLFAIWAVLAYLAAREIKRSAASAPA